VAAASRARKARRDTLSQPAARRTGATTVTSRCSPRNPAAAGGGAHQELGAQARGEAGGEARRATAGSSRRRDKHCRAGCRALHSAAPHSAAGRRGLTSDQCVAQRPRRVEGHEGEGGAVDDQRAEQLEVQAQLHTQRTQTRMGGKGGEEGGDFARRPSFLLCVAGTYSRASLAVVPSAKISGRGRISAAQAPAAAGHDTMQASEQRGGSRPPAA
jgi:hypothetical protein